MTLPYPVRVRHLIERGISVRLDPDQAFGEGPITAGAVCIPSHALLQASTKTDFGQDCETSLMGVA